MASFVRPSFRQASQHYTRRATVVSLSAKSSFNLRTSSHSYPKVMRTYGSTRQKSSGRMATTGNKDEGDVRIDSDGSGEKHSEYEECVRRLYLTNLFHPVKMGLDNIHHLHKLLGRPMDKTTVVHIAGTNGKGSVALKIAKTLELSPNNLKVGLFCSPHVSSFRERMQVNGELITEDEVVEYLPMIYELCEKHDIPATFFEITTALAFKYYDERQVDVVVLETGLGGRLDATNVVEKPAITVITSIGLEHTRILGDTIEKIALEKGGIIKKDRPVLVGPHVPHDVLRKRAAEKQAERYYTCDDVLGVSSTEITDYDEENSRIASAALKLLRGSHPEILGDLPTEMISRGTSARPPCRFEQLEVDGVRVVLDVAHNPPAMEHLVRKLKENYPEDKIRMVVGMSSDKDLKQCARSVLKATANDGNSVHLVQASHPRAAKLEAILDAEPQLKGSCHWDGKNRSVTVQVKSAMEIAKEQKEVLVVCGSVFLMAEAREALGYDEPRDSEYIAEVAGANLKHGQENFGNTLAVTSRR